MNLVAEERDRLKAHDLNFHIVERYEGRDNAVTALTRQANQMESEQHAKWTALREGDLVLCRDHKIDDGHGRKLEPRWTKRKILAKVLEGGVSGLVTDLYSDSGAVKDHLDDLKTHCPSNQSDFPPGAVSVASVARFEIDRKAMSHAQPQGVRTINLTSASLY